MLSTVPLALALSFPAAAEETVHYRLAVRLDPRASRLSVDATVVLPPSTPASIEFLLNATLEVTSAEPGVEVVPTGDLRAMVGDAAAAARLAPLVRRYRASAGTAGGCG